MVGLSYYVIIDKTDSPKIYCKYCDKVVKVQEFKDGIDTHGCPPFYNQLED